MAEAFLSQLWYRVAALRPRLRAHVRVARHRYRGRAWYVLHDAATGRVHRFTPGAYAVIGRFDGTETVDAIWTAAAAALDEDAPSQDDVVQLLARLHQQDLIQHDAAPDVAELLERLDRQAGQLAKQNLMNPISIRVPLWDPDAFLAATLPLVRPLTGWVGLLLWLALVAWGGVTAFVHWEALTADVAARALAAQNIAITLITYPLMKALHEMAHGWLAKARGLEVREMGLMFLVFVPVPYVDASAAAALRDKWGRAAISAGGIFVETAVAAAAVIVWAGAESGFVSAVAFNLALIGGVSTVLVNGNPLLKFDGYFMLCDLVGIPNLGQRAITFWGHLAQRHVFGAKQLREETATFGERAWFLLYAPASYVARLMVTLGIALFVATAYPVVGAAFALWSLFNAVVKPVAKMLRHVVTAPQLARVRARAMRWTFGGVAVAAGLLLFLPLPLRTDAEGVVWMPDEAHARARAAGFILSIDAERGAWVEAGQPLATLEDPTLAARLDALGWRREEHRRRLAAAEAALEERAEIDVSRAELAEAEAELARERARAAALVIRAPVAGRFEPARPPESLPGRRLSEGELLGWVAPLRGEVVRVAVPQDDVALVRDRLAGVAVRLVDDMARALPATVLRAQPAGEALLPSPALGQAGGGRLLTDPADPEGRRAIEPFFVFDLALPPDAAPTALGGRALVRFDHGTEPAGAQIWRRVRQLFLRRFDA